MGRLSFTQTSVFGRFVRALLKPLHRKLHQHPCRERFSPEELSLLAWWAASIRAARPRVVYLKSIHPEVVIYTDAATSTALIASVVIDTANFAKGPAFDTVLTERVGMGRCDNFKDANIIYGLELLAVIAAIIALRNFIAGKTSRFTSTILILRTPL